MAAVGHPGVVRKEVVAKLSQKGMEHATSNE